MSTTSSSAARPTATASAPHSRRRGIGNAQYYLPPLHLQPAHALPRPRGRIAPGDGARGGRELLRPASGQGSRPEQQEHVVEAVARGASRSRACSPVCERPPI